MSRKKSSPPDAADLVDETALPGDDEATIDVAIETLTGDLRDFMLDRLRYEQDKRPWDKRSEFDQRDTIARVEGRVRAAVTAAVELIAAQGRRTIKATLEQVTIKDGIKATISLSKHDEQRHALVDAQGATILIVVADVDEFDGERAPVEITPDQPELMANGGVVHSEPDGAPETPTPAETPFA